MSNNLKVRLFSQIYDEEFVLMVLGKLTELALEDVIPHRC